MSAVAGCCVRVEAQWKPALSPAAVSSRWVRHEIEWALAAEDLATETGEAYRFIPVFTRGITHGFLGWLGRPEVLGIDANGRALADVAGEIAQALGVLPVDARPRPAIAPLAPIAELTLDFSHLAVDVRDDKERVRGQVRVEYQPPVGPRGAAATHDFESPLGPIELGELRWYVEIWPGWSFGKKRLRRAAEVEAALARWGRALFDATLAKATSPVQDFGRETGERRIVVQVPAPADVESSTLDEAERARRVAANGAAARLLALPWELLRGPRGFLFEGARPVRVVRRLPREGTRTPLELDRRILRVLLLVARTSDTGWIDPRVSLTPLVAALAPLGDRVELVVPADGSLTALGAALADAEREGRPFHVVHFDGHGAYDRDKGLGQLVFEDDTDCNDGKIERMTRLVDARRIGGLLKDHRIPLFVLEACQGAEAGAEVTSSVAAELVAAGTGSVVAMSYPVLVETARRFVGAFYPALARGERIGTAMVEAQAALANDPDRSPPGLPRWEMRDWFIPVLFQESGGDVRLLPEAGLPDAADTELIRSTARGRTPGAPAHGFVGRDRELLALSPLLHHNRVVLVRGTGGLGKTALAAEGARWLFDVQRVRRLAWTSVETYGSAEAVLQDLGGQVVAGFAVSRFDSLEHARHAVERALRDRPTLLVIDNFESISTEPDPALVPMLAALSAIGDTRALLTGREPAPPELGAVELQLGALGRRDGRALVEQVLRREARTPREEPREPADTVWIDELVDAVGGHPRSLVRLAPMVAERGARVTRENLASLMNELEQLHPGDRENSPLASVRLSLTRLPPKQRKQVRGLAVFHGAAHFFVVGRVLEIKADETIALCRTLLDLGLAEVEYPYLMPDPALTVAMTGELAQREREQLELRWLAASANLVRALYEDHFKKASSESALARRHALGELLAVVAAVERAVGAGAGSAEEALYVVGMVEDLLRATGNDRAFGLVTVVRQRLESRLVGSSSAAFAARRREIERQFDAGDVAGAVAAARALHQQARALGADAYEGATYDVAMSSLMLAQVLAFANRADEALSVATEAEHEFRELAAAGSIEAATMAARSVSMQARVLKELGRHDDAASAYEKAIEEADALGERHDAAIDRFQLGTVHMLQGRLADAIAAHDQARRTFEDLDEPLYVARAWHRIGNVHQMAERFDAAERAYLRSLDIRTRLQDEDGQARTLNDLGSLCAAAGRPDEAADHYRRAVVLFDGRGDRLWEGTARGNLAESLRASRQYALARVEAHRAIELGREFGDVAQPWKGWSILSGIEHGDGNIEAAVVARQRAIDAYATHRRNGGYPEQRFGQFVIHLTADLADGGSPREFVSELTTRPGTPPNVAAAFACLRTILSGGRDRALLADPALDYDDVVELTLLLETLSSPGGPGRRDARRISGWT